MSWQFIAASDIGGRNEQQDRCAVLHRDGVHLAIVADGVGGHGSGSQAAQTVLDVAEREFREAELGDPQEFLEQLCRRAHAGVLALAPHADGRSCSTCVFLLLKDGEAHWANVGDSRLYLIRDNTPVQQTRDHSVVALRAEQGVPNEPPVGTNVLYMTLGASGAIEPELGACRVRARDAFLLCSDGLWGPVSVDSIADSLGRDAFEPPLAELWARRARESGGEHADNISLVIALNAAPAGAFSTLLARVRERIRRWF